MEKEPILVRPGTERKSVSTKSFYYKELIEDVNAFPPEIQPFVEKTAGGDSLTEDERGVFDYARDQWWKEKYGFPFYNKEARNEVLLRKYAPEKYQEARSLQQDLLIAIAGRDQDRIDELKKRYLEQYPDQLEAIEVIFGIRDFLKKTVDFEEQRKKLSGKERKPYFKDFTEYQFLFTHFLIQNGSDRNFLELFWSVAEKIAQNMGAQRELNILRRAQVSQVAVYRIMERLGEKPKLSHPEEDAFEAIDLWEDADKVIQIKGWEEEVPAVFQTDQIAFPTTTVDTGRSRRFHNSVEYLRSKNNIFRAKIKDYEKIVGKNLEGYMLVVPYSKLDFVNGEPAPELVEFFRDKLSPEQP